MVMTFFFNMSRRFGFIVFQNYVPSSVTTMLSWVSFWIKIEASAARTSVEFAVLNYMIYNQTKRQTSPKLYHLASGSHANTRTRARARTHARARARQQQEVFVCEVITYGRNAEEERQYCPVQQSRRPQCPRRRCDRSYVCFRILRRYLCMTPGCEGNTGHRGRICIHVYRLDNYSRVLFPITFFFFNLLYWLICLNL